MSKCIRCQISGVVQGVWYRANTQEQALSLGITGYARNLPNGSVETVACGSSENLDRLKAWLWQGPAGARVDVVSCEEIEPKEFSGFSTS